MSEPGVTMPPPPFARRPGAPPPMPPADPWAREVFRLQIVQLIGAASGVALAVLAIVMFWMPLIGLLLSLVVVIMHRYQVRLRDYYAAYFVPHGFSEQGALELGYVLGFVGLGLSCLASIGWMALLAVTV